MKKRILAVCLAMVLSLTMLPFQSLSAAADEKAGAAGTNAANLMALPDIGDTLSGFKVKSRSKISELDAQTVLFDHEKSGAELLYIQNDDNELGFNIIYRTPETDETDAEHVFEHAIIASSDKYPSKNIFFDLDGKTYNSFLNAYTYPVITCFPFCSKSEEQLQKMADVYLSCMVAPGIMNNENFFKREAIRYNLEDKKDPITIEGTVYSEDYGSITSINRNAVNNVADALYPGMLASNLLGRSCLNYQDLTYSHIRDVYEKYYSFDNSLIVLYGNMDYKKMLEFIDREYLSKAERKNAGIIKMFDETVPEGHADQTVYVPAYTGDNTEGASRLDYAIDLTGFSDEEKAECEIISSFFQNDGSVFRKKLKEAGLNGQTGFMGGLGSSDAKDYLDLYITEAEEGQREAFGQITVAALKDMAENGASETIAQACYKNMEISRATIRNGTNLGVSVSAQIGILWSLTGRTDFYEQEEHAFEAMKADSSQTIVKSLAAKLMNAKRTALVASVPKAGLADLLDQKLTAELAAKKEKMSDAELSQMIADTKAFDEWNESVQSNADFMIDAADLPDPDPIPSVTEKSLGNITSLSVPVDTRDVGSFKVLFDTSALSQDELKDLSLYAMLLEELDTEDHSAEELDSLSTEYLGGLDIHFRYPKERSQGFHYPMLVIGWTGLDGDYETSANLLLDMMQHSNFNDSAKIIRSIERHKNDFNEAKGDAYEEAKSLADAYTDPDKAYKKYMCNQDIYHDLLETERKLNENPSYAAAIQERMTELEGKIVQQNRMVTMTAASAEAIPAVEEAVLRTFGTLTTGIPGTADYVLPYQKKAKVAAFVESSNQDTVFISVLSDHPEMKGSYLPYLSAVSDRYVVPKLRFQDGAYSAGTGGRLKSDKMFAYAYSDPNVKSSVEALYAIPDQISKAELGKDDFNGYILNAYGAENKPVGNLDAAMDAMDMRINGIDPGQLIAAEKDIKNASLSEQQAAADAIRRLMQNGTLVMVGNEEKMKGDAACFDEVIDFRN